MNDNSQLRYKSLTFMAQKFIFYKETSIDLYFTIT
jgi:hypothetical protein